MSPIEKAIIDNPNSSDDLLVKIARRAVELGDEEAIKKIAVHRNSKKALAIIADTETGEG